MQKVWCGMVLNLVSMLSSKKTEVPSSVRMVFELATRTASVLENFEVLPAGIYIRNGMFFNNILENKVIFELLQHAGFRELQKGQKVRCAFSLLTRNDRSAFFSFTSRILSLCQTRERNAVYLELPFDFDQHHMRNGPRISVPNDTNLSLSIWSTPPELPNRLRDISHMHYLLKTRNHMDDICRIRDISKTGLGLILLDDIQETLRSKLAPGASVLFSLTLSEDFNMDAVHCLGTGTVVRQEENRGRSFEVGISFNRLASRCKDTGTIAWHDLHKFVDKGIPALHKFINVRLKSAEVSLEQL